MSATCCRATSAPRSRNYPASVNTLIAQALPWSIAIQLPAIIIGWIVGNLLGALAAFKGGWFDRGAFIGSLFFSSIPPFALAIILLFLVAVKMGILPVGGAYSFGLTPEFSLAFFGDAITLLLVTVLVARAGLHRRPGGRHAVHGHLRARLGLRELQPWPRASRRATRSATSSAMPCCRSSRAWRCPSPPSSRAA